MMRRVILLSEAELRSLSKFLFMRYCLNAVWMVLAARRDTNGPPYFLSSISTYQQTGRPRPVKGRSRGKTAGRSYLLVLEVGGELIAVRESFAPFALFLLLLAERQAGRLVSAALSPGEACRAGGGDGRAALRWSGRRRVVSYQTLKNVSVDPTCDLPEVLRSTTDFGSRPQTPTETGKKNKLAGDTADLQREGTVFRRPLACSLALAQLQIQSLWIRAPTAPLIPRSAVRDGEPYLRVCVRGSLRPADGG